MTKRNIIPNKIPIQIWEIKQYQDVILYALGVYGPMRREEFINSSEKGITNRMNKNTFHKWAKKLKSKNHINVTRDQKKSVYTITSLGIKELLKRLKSYRLDVKTILNLEQKAISKNLNQITQFLNLFNIKNQDIVIEFLKLRNELTTDKLRSFTEDKLNLSILYLSLNHVKFYDGSRDISISIDNFIKKYGKNKLTKTELKLFLHKVIVKEVCYITFYELKELNRDNNMYFRSTDEYGTIFKGIIQSILRDHYYLGVIDSNSFNEIIINDLCEEILFELIDKYNLFHKNLEIPLYNLIRNYLLNLLKEFKSNYLVYCLNLKEIPSLILTSDIFIFERLDYLQKKAIIFLEKANEELLPYKYMETVNIALEIVEKAISIDVKNSLNYVIKTQIYQYKGEYEKALRLIKKAIKLDPAVADYYLNLASILIWMNKYEKALIVMKKAIEIEPNVAEYYSQLASVFCFLEQYEKALETLGVAINIKPKMIKYHLQKARYLAHYLKEYKDALNVIEQVIEPKMEKYSLFELYREQAGILLNMKNNEEAQKVIKKARQLYPSEEIFPNIS